MTLTNEKRLIRHEGNGATTNFPYDFLIPDANSVIVSLWDEATDTTTVLNPSQYNITGLGDPNFGEVTYPLSGSPIAAGTWLVIEREVAYTQDLLIKNQGGFFADSTMAQLDRIVMQTQQLAEMLERTPKFSPGSGVSNIRITQGDEGTALIWDADGNIVEGPSTTEIESAQTYATEAKVAQAAAEDAAQSAALSSAAAGAASGRLDIADFSQLATDFVYGSPNPGQQQVAPGDVILWREKGIAWKVASSTATDAHLDYTGGGGVQLYILPDASGCLPFEAWGGRRAEDDPLFDNSDVFDLIHDYVHSNKGIGVERAIKFPIGRFNHSRTLKIDWGHATFIGSGSLAGAAGPTPEHPVRSDGTFICYTGNDGGVGVDVGSGSSNFIYHVTIENIRFGASGASTANCTVMRWKGLSEFYFRNVALQTGNVLLELDNVGIGNLRSFYMSVSSEAHMLFNGETGQIGQIWFENANLWHAENSVFKFIVGPAQRVSFTDSWVELAEHIFEFAPEVDAFANFSAFQFVRTRFQTGSDFDDGWPTPGREGWFIKAVPSQDYTNRSLFIDGWVFEDCEINISDDSSPGTAVVYDRGNNVGGQSLIQNMTFRGGYFTGTLGAYTIFKGGGTVFCYGTRKTSSIQWTDGSTIVARLGQEFHYWEFDGRPVRLPVIQSPSSTTAGQIYWHQGTQLPRIMDQGGVARVILYNMPVTTAGRPALSGGSVVGVMVFDTDLGKPIWWNGSKWVDATGAEASS